MPPKQKIWSAESETQLIFEVQRRPILWDISLTEYRRNDLKDVHWEKVARQLGSIFSCEMVKKRFTNMRETFMDNHKRIKDSMRSGIGTEDVYKPKWPLYQSLQFLLKTVAQAESMSNIDLTECHSKDSATADLDAASSLSSPANVYFDDNTQEFMLIPSDPNPNPTSGPSAPSAQQVTASSSGSSGTPATSMCSTGGSTLTVLSPLSSPEESCRPSSAPPTASMFQKRGQKRANNPLAEEALQVMKKIVSEPVVLPVVAEDAADKFGAFVASKLRGMDPNRRNLCEAQIVKLLYE